MGAEGALLDIIDELALEEARLISSTAVVLVTVVAYLLSPLIVRRLVDLRRYEFIDHRFGEQIEYLEQTIKWPFPTRAVVRVIQVTVLFVAGMLLLVVWGYEHVAAVIIGLVMAWYPYLIRLAFTIVLLLGGLLVLRVFEDLLDAYTEDADYITEHQEGTAFRVLQIAVYGAVLIATVSLWGVDLTGLLVGAGFLGIVLGMAAQKTLGSLIAGLVLMFSRPFEIGDWVQIGDHEGIVTDISIVNTRLRSFNDEAVVIPNDSFSNRTVVNYSTSERLRLSIDVGIAYDTDVERASELALAAIEDLDMILRNPQPSVVPTAFNDSSIGLRLRYWIEYPSKPKEWKAHAAVLTAVKQTFEEHDIEIPFPQRTLSGTVPVDESTLSGSDPSS